MNKNRISTLAILFIIFGCNNDKNLRSNMLKSIDNYFNSPNADSFYIYNLDNNINFDWDTLHIFGEYTTSEEISSAIGFDCNCKSVGDSKECMIFTKDRAIVHMEISNIKKEDYKLQFIPKNRITKGHLKYSKYETKFFVYKEYSNDGRVFYNIFPPTFMK